MGTSFLECTPWTNQPEAGRVNTSAELGSDRRMGKSACQGVEMCRFGYRIHW